MKTDTLAQVDKTQLSRPTRVPIPLNAEEERTLEQYAAKEQRSKSSMAGIIYRLGLKAYAEQRRVNRR